MADLRIGIDVGGTNTDAVVLDADGRVLAKAKRPTTPEVTDGLRAALDAVLEQVEDRSDVTRVMLGTTHATNAILERRALGRVAVLRLGAPATTAVPPLSDWPDDLREVVSAGEAIVPGGHYVDGREIGPLDLDAVRRFLDGVEADAVAVTGVFSPADDAHERRVAELVAAEYGLPVSVSHEIGSLGLLERENATVLNAALYGVAAHVTDALVTALAERGLSARPYLAQNDGTLMTLEQAARLPVSTIGSGPANSLRGAAYLSGGAGRDRRGRRWHLHRPGGCWSAGSRGSRRRRPRSAACSPTSACRTSWPSRSAAAPWSGPVGSAPTRWATGSPRRRWCSAGRRRR
ncbi:hydantoinase/oxoprolinase family protein [Nonomuraea salmonea]|uniref:hydantoinase/oxoprolinase family protein n=1 Tax=Nonomuraea salmonea TaxID=46181 RepID=UPI002FEA7CB9